MGGGYLTAKCINRVQIEVIIENEDVGDFVRGKYSKVIKVVKYRKKINNE